MLWPLSVVLVANTNGRLAIPALAGLLVALLIYFIIASKLVKTSVLFLNFRKNIISMVSD